jgi:basic amino acid/polyamine antiporter, APA family
LAQPHHRSNADDMSKALSSEPPHEQHLVRTLGLGDVVMIGIAGMIGGAIFVLVGPAIGLAGSAVIIAFIINGIITLFTAMAYTDLQLQVLWKKFCFRRLLYALFTLT